MTEEVNVLRSPGFRQIDNNKLQLIEKWKSHKTAMDQICLALNTNNFKTKVIIDGLINVGFIWMVF